MKTEDHVSAGGAELEFRMLTPLDRTPAWSHCLRVVFVLQGAGWLQVEGGSADYALRQGDIFAVNSFHLCSVALDEGALAITLFIAPAFLSAFSPETASPTFDCKSFLYGEERKAAFDELRRDFARAFRAQYKSESQLPVHLRGKAAALVDTLFRQFYSLEAAGRAGAGRERLRAAVDYIHRHYRENISLANLAASTYLSESYISRSFQKQFGVSFTGYLARVRLLHASALLRGEATVTEIAYDSGFSSANAMIEAFKQYRGTTPGQYRRRMKQAKAAAPAPPACAEEGFSTAFASLMAYLEAEAAAPAAAVPAAGVLQVRADVNAVKRPAAQTWKRLINGGYARNLLDAALQEQIRSVQRAAGFQYIRCKGLLDDDMVLFTKDIYGNTEMNYVYVDEAIDFILSTGAKPMLEFSHMPSALAKQAGLAFRRPTVISAPSDYDAWGGLIRGLTAHLLARYGAAALRGWLFSPWCAPDFSLFGLFTLEEYTATWLASYRVIKSVLPDARICGPGCTVHSMQTMSWFLDLCRENDCLPDILTFRSFAAMEPDAEPGALRLAQSAETFPLAVSGDEDYLKNTRRAIRAVAKQKNADYLPVMLEEWSNNIWQRDLCNDTSYKSAYLFKSVLESGHRYDGMGYFSVGDQLDEIAPAAGMFHGGFGLFTRSGLPKSAFRALELLARQGGAVLSGGSGYCVTATEEEVQVFLYNYCHYDLLYRYRHTTNLTKTERYRVFNERPAVACHIEITGLAPGPHTVRRYSVGPGGGSSYDAWLAMGAPQQTTAEEERRLSHLSHAVYRTEQAEANGALRLSAGLVPHEVQLITISR